jgi:hypothetical protein
MAVSLEGMTTLVPVVGGQTYLQRLLNLCDWSVLYMFDDKVGSSTAKNYGSNGIAATYGGSPTLRTETFLDGTPTALFDGSNDTEAGVQIDPMRTLRLELIDLMDAECLLRGSITGNLRARFEGLLLEYMKEAVISLGFPGLADQIGLTLLALGERYAAIAEAIANLPSHPATWNPGVLP